MLFEKPLLWVSYILPSYILPSCIRSRSIQRADGSTERSHVVLPVARGPKRKNEPFGNAYARGNIPSILTVKSSRSMLV